MNIWGKIIGGAAGFALGGPIGGVVGTIAGHAVDIYAEDSHVSREAAFTIALIALSAKMAKADGIVTRDEILAFREKVDIAPEDMEKVGNLWDLARETPDGYAAYATQVARLFEPASAVLEQLMAMLFHIARADGEITSEEQAYLEHVADILGFDAKGFTRLTHIHGDSGISPYRILGLDPDCDDAELRQCWLALNRDHHPDRLMAEGLPDEFIRAATERLAAINQAYDRLKKERGMS